MEENKMASTKLLSRLLSLALGMLLIGGCAISSKHYSSSVVQYLYPEQKDPIETPEVPLLSLPASAGIAFVPDTAGTHYNLTEADKSALMKEVADHFKQYDFLKSIELIPSAYLVPKGGFANLDQIRTMFGIDLVALISYDQAQFTDEGLASITYWTLVGAYVVPGEKNDTHTMLDAVVYDIQSRKMLFRAPGTSHIKSRATPVNLTEQLRIDSREGFREASQDMIVNLDQQLQLFKVKVKESPQDFKVVHKPGYTGGGSLDALSAILIVAFVGVRLWIAQRSNA
jgi:rhombotail lipoprotein